MQQPKFLTVICPIIRPDLVERMLETLYEYTENIFYCFIIDQTVHGIDATALRNKYKNLMVIRPPKSDTYYTGNLGFAKATNLGIQLTQTPYFMMCNDDVEFINSKWWQGVLDTFEKVEKATPERPAVIVNPSTIKLPDWSVGREKGDDHYILPYKSDYTEEDWNFLIKERHYVNERMTIEPDTVIDGVTMYASVCHTQRFLEVGMLNERYYPGAGEDYSYSCRAAMVGYRCVGTTLSYVYHHWSMTFKALQDQEEVKSLAITELYWNKTDEEWGPGFDIWGVKCPKCSENMRCPPDDKTVAYCPKHPEEKFDMPPVSIMPL